MPKMHVSLVSDKAARLIQAETEIARAQGVHAYAVGGFVRDLLLKRPTHDLDIAVKGDVLTLARALADRLDGCFVPLHEDRAIVRVVVKSEDDDFQIDLTPVQHSIERELKRRDFTINALAIPIEQLCRGGEVEVLDPAGGLKHLEERRLVLLGSFEDDPIRILRAFRLAATIRLSLDTPLLAAVTLKRHLLSGAAAERIRDEFCLTLQADGAVQSLRLLDQTGVLQIILPELEPLKQVPAGGYHHLDGFNHTLEVVRGVEEISDFGFRISGELEELLAKEVPTLHQAICERRTGVCVAKLTALLHDVAKPKTMSRDEEGDLHFYEHEKVGAGMAGEICRRLKLSAVETKIVTTVVANHLRPLSLASVPEPTPRALRRFWRQLGDTGLYVVIVSTADVLATQGKEMTQEQQQKHFDLLAKLMRTWQEMKEVAARPKLLSGDDVMRRYGLSPGPKVGRALRLIEEAQMDGQVRTTEEALQWLEAHRYEWTSESGEDDDSAAKVI